jgi:hypothetical protein
MQRVYRAVIALALQACYAPKVVGGEPCDPTNAGSCPSGLTCVGTGNSGTCMADGVRVDAATGGGSGSGDGGPCLGAHLLGNLCLQKAPTGPVMLAGSRINSASTEPGNCTEIVPQGAGPSLCVVAGTTIEIPAGATLRAFAVSQGAAATGTNPLVLFATGSITVTGAIDVASHVKETIAGGIPALGAGARTAIGCAASGLDGTSGRAASGGSFGGGGGAGGSFGTLGGAGGFGGNASNVAHGNPVASAAPTALIGGCPGGNGGGGDGGDAPGPGGNGGGAVYLIAGESITISGKINASGAGGSEGGAGNNSSGAGGGGGAGGMIGLESARITVATAGALFANGGGGGAGNGGVPENSGTPGGDAAAPGTGAAAGTGTGGGGGGGIGSVGAGVGMPGKNGSGGNHEAAGGGGGGGAGAIRIFSGQPASIQGSVSPPAPAS